MTHWSGHTYTFLTHDPWVRSHIHLSNQPIDQVNHSFFWSWQAPHGLPTHLWVLATLVPRGTSSSFIISTVKPCGLPTHLWVLATLVPWGTSSSFIISIVKPCGLPTYQLNCKTSWAAHTPLSPCKGSVPPPPQFLPAPPCTESQPVWQNVCDKWKKR
jgi:hypothetical protein